MFLVVFGFVILTISFVIAFLSLISEEKKHKQAVLEHAQPSVSVEPLGEEAQRVTVSKEDIVKMATNSPILAQVPFQEEDLSEPKEEVHEAKKIVDQVFPWEEDDVLFKQEELSKPITPVVQTQKRDDLFGEFKIPRKEE